MSVTSKHMFWLAWTGPLPVSLRIGDQPRTSLLELCVLLHQRWQQLQAACGRANVLRRKGLAPLHEQTTLRISKNETMDN